MTAAQYSLTPVLAVVGPTASGKSSLAHKLALDLSGEIVNVDSVQVYKEFDIGSAKVSALERQELPHHLIDLFEPDQMSNVAKFCDAAYPVLGEILKRKKLPILCGGTGLYITCLFHGLAALPQKDEKLRESFAQRTLEDLYRELHERDPESASKIGPKDRIRVVRALEAVTISGSVISRTLEEHGHREKRCAGLIVVPCWSRAELYNRIEQRSKLMVESGLLAETKGILERYGSEIQGLKSLGYSQAVQCLSGALGQEELVETIAKSTRNFAKRQLTFFRNEPKKRGWKVRPLPSELALEIEPGSISQTRKSRLAELRALDFDYLELVEQIKLRLKSGFESNELWYVAAGRL